MAKVFILVLASLLAAAGCQKAPDNRLEEVSVSKKLTVSSSAFKDGGSIPLRFTAYGDNVSPPLQFGDVPSETRSLFVLLDDPDAVGNPPFTHWMLANVDPNRPLPDGFNGEKVPSGVAGVVQGNNSRNQIGYFGPRPPAGSGVHHYHFHAYALDTKLDLKPGFDKSAATDAMKGHIIAEGDLVGTYEGG